MNRMTTDGAGIADIEAVYRAGLPRFVRAATALTGDPEAGRDAVQDAFAGAIRKRCSYRGEGPLEAWLWRWVVNAARDRRRRDPDMPMYAAPEPAIIDHAGPVAERAALIQALGRLTERQRLVLLLRHFGDLDYAAIATALEIAPSSVGPALAQARDALRLTFEEVSR
jgi:RNA polymerase sigma-70 factor (ECF subfamily)